MPRSTASHKRSKPRFKTQPLVLVICEDSKSSKCYLEDASRHFRCNTQVKVTHCGNTDPQGIINEAIGLRNKFDHIFCVIDRDAHPKFDIALNQAKQFKNITVIASYPCFEFWLLLHFSHTRKPYKAIGSDSAADLLIRDLRRNKGMESYAKDSEQKIFASLLGEKLTFAITVAPKVLIEAVELGMNPSTYIHELLEHFQAYGKLELIEGG